MAPEGIPQKTEQEVFNELQTIRRARYSEAPEDTHDRIIRFDRELKGKCARKQIMSSRLYHMLIGSTPFETTTLDVPGGLIETFIREEL